MIVVGAVVVLLLCAGVGLGGYLLLQPDKTKDAAPLADLQDYRRTEPDMLTRLHRTGRIAYPVRPPVGGDHAPLWQNCQGTVYAEPIADEQAVHSLEHGAVWITYSPDLPADQVEILARQVRGKDYTLMSPYPGLASPVSLQAWGYRLPVDRADHPGVAAFLTRFRISASVEPGASCAGGIPETGTTPRLN